MWLSWIIEQAVKLVPAKVNVVCRTADGREFSPFSIEWRGSTLILCENEEDGE